MLGDIYCNTNGLPNGIDGILFASIGPNDAPNIPFTPEQTNIIRNGIILENITCLLRNSTSSGGIVYYHGCLLEFGYEPIVNNLKIYNGFAGFVSKTHGGNYNNINCYGNSIYAIILKTNVGTHSSKTNLNNFVIDSINTTTKDCGGGILIQVDYEISTTIPYYIHDFNISNGNINNINNNSAINYTYISSQYESIIYNLNLSNININNISSDAILLDGLNYNLNNIIIKNITGNGIKIYKTELNMEFII